MKNLQKQNEVVSLMKLLRAHSFRNVSGILSEELYEDCFLSTKTLIEDFLNEFCQSLEFVANSFSVSNEVKMEFFSEMRHAFGKTALMLSGGASFGLYHGAIIKVFSEADIMPKIICGSSSGALVGALLGTRPVSEWKDIAQKIDYSALDAEKEDKKLLNVLRRFFREGNLLDLSCISKCLEDNLGDLTFQEAFDKTQMILNISVSGEGKHNQHMILNYLTSPNVLIRSAAAASCGIPFIFGAQDILAKDEFGNVNRWMPHGGRKFIDGSIDFDIPLAKIAELFNVNHFIVSQTNPWFDIFIQGHSFCCRFIFVPKK